MDIENNKTTAISRYATYKDSGVEWLGEIPAHWEVKRLGAIIEPKSDKNHPDYEVLSVYRDYGVIPKSSRDDNHNATSLDTSNYKAVEPGDLVINKMKAWQGSMGVSAYKGIVSPAYITCKVSHPSILSTYLHSLLRCHLYIGEYNRISYGVRVGQWDMRYEDLKQVTIPIPPLEEQTAIAQYLEVKCEKIDLAVRQKEQLIALLQERKQAMIQNAVTKGIRPKAPLKPSGIDWIGDIPEGWDILPIRRLIDVRDGTHDTPVYIDESPDSFYLITSKDFKKDDIDFTNAKSISKKDHIEISKRSGVVSGDVLMSMIGGNIGKSVIIGDFDNFSIKNVALFKTGGNIVMAKFLRFYLQSGLLDKQVEINSRGGAQGFISLGDTRNLLFFHMSNQERKEIVAHIETETAKIDRAIALQSEQIAKLQEYKASLINAVVTGKRKVVK